MNKGAVCSLTPGTIDSLLVSYDKGIPVHKDHTQRLFSSALAGEDSISIGLEGSRSLIRISNLDE